MTVLGLDDTDSATRGMCTTYLATVIAETLPDASTTYLIRLNPAIKHKTRGNGAVAIQTTTSLDTVFDLAEDIIDERAIHHDPETNPGLIGIDTPPSAIPTTFTRFGVEAIRDVHQIAAVDSLLAGEDTRSRGWGTRRGLIGAAAAIGAVGGFCGNAAVADGIFHDLTYEYIAYRAEDVWGSPRTIDAESVRTASASHGDVWDTVDSLTGELVCVPASPCPVLFGIRGETEDAVTSVGRAIDGESTPHSRVFITNQGTDNHLRTGVIPRLRDGRSYRVGGIVSDTPDTGRGGHVTVRVSDGRSVLPCLAFEPTKRFRKTIRQLRSGDRVVVCGEYTDGALKLEKFYLHELQDIRLQPPDCPDCDRRMSSAGWGQGYRCRDCRTHAAGKVRQSLDRDLEPGWYEVPPRARRHLSKPLARTTRAQADS